MPRQVIEKGLLSKIQIESKFSFLQCGRGILCRIACLTVRLLIHDDVAKALSTPTSGILLSWKTASALASCSETVLVWVSTIDSSFLSNNFFCLFTTIYLYIFSLFCLFSSLLFSSLLCLSLRISLFTDVAWQHTPATTMQPSGKGRQIAGLVYNNYLQKRCRAVWFSSSGDLAEDARRDLKDIGAASIKILKAKDMKPGNTISQAKKGLMFCTYTLLAGSRKVDKETKFRIDEITKWCKGGRDDGDFDGLLVFDECHSGKNATGKGATKMGEAMIKIQELLPRARVVYVSATVASELAHMASMDRLGLWGKGTAFADHKTFEKSLQANGVAAMELVAMDMKARGLFLSRTLSYAGAEFTTSLLPAPGEYKIMYNSAVTIWYNARELLNRMIEEGEAEKSVMKLYWAFHLEFFKQLALGAKVDGLVQKVKDARKSDYCVVIGMQTTGEAATKKKMEDKGRERFDGTMLVSVAYEKLRALLRLIEMKLGESTHASQSSAHDSGGGHSGGGAGAAGAAAGGGVQDDDDDGDSLMGTGVQPTTALFKKLRIDVENIADDLPRNPIDYLIDRLGGPDKVAEMSGRTHRIVRARSGTFEYQARSKQRGAAGNSAESASITERKHFQGGKKLIAIITDSASTGVSLQADRNAVNQKRRCHFTFEL